MEDEDEARRRAGRRWRREEEGTEVMMTECLRDKPDTGAGNRIESMGGGGWREEEPGLPREGPGACWLAAAVGCCAVWRPGRCARRCFFFSLSPRWSFCPAAQLFPNGPGWAGRSFHPWQQAGSMCPPVPAWWASETGPGRKIPSESRPGGAVLICCGCRCRC